jgi:hypothetical protein
MPVYWALARDEALRQIAETVAERGASAISAAAVAMREYDMNGEITCCYVVVDMRSPMRVVTRIATTKVHSTLSSAFQLARINASVDIIVNNLVCSMPLDSTNVQAKLVNEVARRAQLLISWDHAVTFLTIFYEGSNYDGWLYGYFQVAKKGDPSNIARDGYPLIIKAKHGTGYITF